jgi:hypothetical protein
MDLVLDYLRAPLKVGVQSITYTLNMSLVLKGIRNLTSKCEKAEKGKVSARVRYAKERLDEAMDKLQEYYYVENVLDVLQEVFLRLAALPGCPADMRDLFYEKAEARSGISPHRFLRRQKSPLFKPTMTADDVVYIEESPSPPLDRLLLTATTIGDPTLTYYKRCLQTIPPVREGMTVLKEGRRFSSRFAFKPYPLVVRLWLGHESSTAFPSDLKTFLDGAVEYYYSSEWRTSIVLSAITVESILADLYEEKKKEPAPDIPLGGLLEKVKNVVAFPKTVLEAMDSTNKARIAAVHRSISPVSDREATNALFGATNLALWYHEVF